MNLKKLLSATGLLTMTVPTSLSVIACDSNTIFKSKNTKEQQIIDEINNAEHQYRILKGTKSEILLKTGLGEIIKKNLTQDNKKAFDTNKFEVISFRNAKTWLPISDNDLSKRSYNNESILDYKYNNIKSRAKLTFYVVSIWEIEV